MAAHRLALTLGCRAEETVALSESDQADTQGVDDMNDNDEWVGYSHWGLFPLK
jgi:hypothetical protein